METKHDLTLSGFYERALERASSLRTDHAVAKVLFAQAVVVLSEEHAVFRAIIDEAVAEQDEALNAAAATRQARAACEQALDVLHAMLMAHYYTLRARSSQDAADFNNQVRRALTRLSPSDVRDIALQRLLTILDALATLGARTRGEEDEAVVAARAALAEARARRDQLDREGAESTAAASALHAGRERARRGLRVARLILQAGLLLIDREDDLGQIINNLSDLETPNPSRPDAAPVLLDADVALDPTGASLDPAVIEAP